MDEDIPWLVSLEADELDVCWDIDELVNEPVVMGLPGVGVVLDVPGVADDARAVGNCGLAEDVSVMSESVIFVRIVSAVPLSVFAEICEINEAKDSLTAESTLVAVNASDCDISDVSYRSCTPQMTTVYHLLDGRGKMNEEKQYVRVELDMLVAEQSLNASAQEVECGGKDDVGSSASLCKLSLRYHKVKHHVASSQREDVSKFQ